MATTAIDLVVDDLTVEGRARHIRKAEGHMVVVAVVSVVMTIVFVEMLGTSGSTGRAEVVVFVVEPC